MQVRLVAVERLQEADAGTRPPGPPRRGRAEAAPNQPGGEPRVEAARPCQGEREMREQEDRGDQNAVMSLSVWAFTAAISPSKPFSRKVEPYSERQVASCEMVPLR